MYKYLLSPLIPLKPLFPLKPLKRHFTATAFIINSQKETLLLWHKRLQRWMPPGGHIHENETPEDAAKRECKEETGLDVEIHGDSSPNLFQGAEDEGRMLKKPIAMLLEYIPEFPERNEPAHEHMDFLFVATPLDEMQVPIHKDDEADSLQWFTRTDIEKLNEHTEIFSNVKQYILNNI